MNLSVIIPCYNSERYLPETLASILDQPITDMEVLLVNDGGKSPATLAETADPRIRIIELPENAGVSAARNRGLAEATGEIVHFLDSDDIVSPDLYAHILAMFADPAIDALVVGGAHHNMDIEGSDGLRRPPVPDLTPPEVLDTDGFCAVFEIDYGNLFLPSFLFVRRNSLIGKLRPAPWNEGRNNHEDVQFFLELGAVMDIAMTPTIGVTYRRHGSGLSGSISVEEHFRTRIDRMQEIYDMPRQGPRAERVRKTAWKVRQHAVRRRAQLLRQSSGRRVGALRLMLRYLHPPFDPKMAVSMLLMAVTGSTGAS